MFGPKLSDPSGVQMERSIGPQFSIVNLEKRKRKAGGAAPLAAEGCFGGVISNLLTHSLSDRSTMARRRLNSCALACRKQGCPPQ